MSISQYNEGVNQVDENVNKEDKQREAEKKEKDRSCYLPLYKAALNGDWESAKSFFEEHKDAVTAVIGADLETALHVVIGTGKGTHFVKNLVNLMPNEALSLRALFGETALHIAARVGYTEAAVILVEKNPALLNIARGEGDFNLPVHWAAVRGHRETLGYLLAAIYKEAVDRVPISLTGHFGVALLVHVINSGFFDAALDLVERNPVLGRLKLPNGNTGLTAIAGKTSAFPSGRDLNLYERFIYSWTPAKFEDALKNPNHVRGDIEDPADNSTVFPRMCGSIRLFAQHFFHYVPQIKEIQHTKLMHHQALRLVEILCMEIRSLNDSEAYLSFTVDPVLEAAQRGIPEFVEKIVDEFPDAAHCNLENRYFILHTAVIKRCKNIFNLAKNQVKYKSQYAALFYDESRNNILHFAGKLAPVHKLNLVSGAALQMQSELQWFKVVETLVDPSFKVMGNRNNETPEMVFTREHKNLVIEGEKWMKDTANSCTIVAALIVTVVFAAAITVPGGNNGENGHPIFHKEKAFIFFAITDAISLFTSTTSLLMFLSILTSRYSESDFLLILPRRLIIGLVTLFFSITAMMMAFSATLYLLFDGGKAWHLVPVIALACLPITSFVLLQFPLLVDVIRSTYWPGI